MIATDDLHVGDVGTAIVLVVEEGGVPADIAAATALEIHAEKPSGATVKWTAALDGGGADGRLRYVTQPGDLDEAGYWLLQAYVELPAWQGHTESVRVKVKRSITV